MISYDRLYPLVWFSSSAITLAVATLLCPPPTLFQPIIYTGARVALSSSTFVYISAPGPSYSLTGD